MASKVGPLNRLLNIAGRTGGRIAQLRKRIDQKVDMLARQALVELKRTAQKVQTAREVAHQRVSMAHLKTRQRVANAQNTVRAAQDAVQKVTHPARSARRRIKGPWVPVGSRA